MYESLTAALPFLRRYARALTGSQARGDDVALSALSALVEGDDPDPTGVGAKVALFRSFHKAWQARGARFQPPDDGPEALAFGKLAKLTTNSREALLLHAVEEFSMADVGAILGISAEEAEFLCNVARAELSQGARGRVMIIEDEALIAMEIEELVRDLGHDVIGIAPTRRDAIMLSRDERPDLVLADIHLADNSSGIDAVADIIAAHSELPVIFITAFPERLLTGRQDEPAFLIRKPFDAEQVKSSIAQAMFFASTQPLQRNAGHDA